MKIPTRIIKPPTYRKVQVGALGGRKTMFLTCNDGREYKVGALALLLGLSSSGLSQRISRYGWEYEKILFQTTKPGGKLNRQLCLRTIADSGSEEWRRLSSKPRTSGLARLCLPGIFEQRMEDGK